MALGSRLLADVRPLRESPAFRRLWAGVTAGGPQLGNLEAGALASLTTPLSAR